MKLKGYYSLRLLGSVIVGAAYELITVALGKQFKTIDLITYIIVLYVGTIAVNALADMVETKSKGAEK